MGKPTI